MPRIISPPFLTAPKGSVGIIAWTLPDGDPLPAEWPGWDPTVDIHVTVTLEIDADRVIRDCQIQHDVSALMLTTTWRSGGTSMRGKGDARRLNAGSGEKIVLDLLIPGAELMGDVECSVQLVLAESPKSRTAVSPWRVGSVLWSHSRKILLGGMGGRFPIEWTEFSNSGQFHRDSGWQLDWNPDDLDVPALAGLRLYMNSESSPLVSAVESGANDHLLGFMHFNVARTLLMGVLENPEIEHGKFEDDSVGAVMTRLLKVVFEGDPVPAVRQRMFENRAHFESELQGRLKLLTGRAKR